MPKKLKSPDPKASSHSHTHSTSLLSRIVSKSDKSKTSKWVILACTSATTSKSISISKYHRKLIHALWEENGTTLSIIISCLNNHNQLTRSIGCAIKGLILLLRIFHFGPPQVLKDSSSSSASLTLVDGVCSVWAARQAEAAWQESNEDEKKKDKSNNTPSFDKNVSLLIARLASLVSAKIRFHCRHPEFSSHYTELISEMSNAPPEMPRLLTVKSLSVLLDLGAGCDAVCAACFEVINQSLRIDYCSNGNNGNLENGNDIENDENFDELAIVASFALAPVLDESALIFNVCEHLFFSLRESALLDDDTIDMQEVRKNNLRRFKLKASAPSQMVYGR